MVEKRRRHEGTDAVTAKRSGHRMMLLSLGCGVRLDLPGPALLALFGAAYGSLCGEARSLDVWYSIGQQEDGGYTLLRDGTEVGAAEDATELMWLFDGDLCVELQKLRSQHYFLHAAALGLAGRGCVFVGGMGAGKSTLSWALCHHDFEYLSDEMAPVDLSRLTVRRFPRSIALKDDPPPPYPAPPASVRTARTLHIPGSAMPSPLGADELPLTALFVVTHDPEAAEPTLQPISSARAATHAYTHALNPLAHPADGIDAAIRIATGSVCFELVAADLESSCRLVKSTVENLLT